MDRIWLWSFLIGLFLLLVVVWGVLAKRGPAGRLDATTFEDPSAEELRKIQGWICPGCKRPYGPESRSVKPPAIQDVDDFSGFPPGSHEFVDAYIIICNDCKGLNIFDSHGNHKIAGAHWPSSAGDRFGREYLDCLAKESCCPYCSATYQEWSGEAWGSSYERIEGASDKGPFFRVPDGDPCGPILLCSSCGKRTHFDVKDGKLEPQLPSPP
jgi:hypothetical protein